MVVKVGGEGERGSSLSERDKRSLVEVERKLQPVRDGVTAVATGLSTGMYVYGPGGLGKTHTVVSELERLDVPYRLSNSHMSSRGLFDTLEEYPDEIHVFEDMESVARHGDAPGVLRSALWGPTKPNANGRYERPVTWVTRFMTHGFVFTGGIIMLANRPLGDDPELEAIKTRIRYFQLYFSAQEVMAKMRAIALGGHRHGPLEMTPAECSEVCEFVIANAIALDQKLDLRLLIKAFGDYLLWQENRSGCTWQDLVLTEIKKRPIGIGEVVTAAGRSDRRRMEADVAREIKELPREERVRVWIERTGKSEKSMYRRLAEIKGD